MAYPTVQTSNTSYEASGTTTHTVNLPSGISNGDLLLIFMTFDGGDPRATFPAGYNEIFDQADTGDRVSMAVAYRNANGAEGSTISVDTDTSRSSAHNTYRITGHDSGTAPEISSSASGTGNTPNPDSLTPTGGAKDYLWFALYGQDGDSGTGPWDATAAPSNYTNLVNQTSQSATFGNTLAVARRENNASSEDPGTFTAESSAEEWIAATLAVHPAAAAGNPWYAYAQQ